MTESAKATTFDVEAAADSTANGLARPRGALVTFEHITYQIKVPGGIR